MENIAYFLGLVGLNLAFLFFVTYQLNRKYRILFKDVSTYTSKVDTFLNSTPKTIEELYFKSSKDISKIVPIRSEILDVCAKLQNPDYPWHINGTELISEEYKIWIANQWYGLNEIVCNRKKSIFLNQKEKELLISYLEAWLTTNGMYAIKEKK